MKEKKITISQITFMALMAAVTCVLAPLSIYIGPVPISFTNLVVYFTVFVLGTKLGTGSYCLYVLLGAVGLPVFSGFTGGLGKIAGPTGGYIIGFVFMAAIGGFIMERADRRIIPTVFGWVLGTAVDYAMGTAWFVIVAHCSVVYALTVCVVPFIFVDIVKIILGTVIAKEVRKGLIKANIISGSEKKAAAC
ncbi:MAG: biotin transporter BioY [Eubacteriales bacterium]|nr:biotin transporter BioY [Eubacteriales bacterium]